MDTRNQEPLTRDFEMVAAASAGFWDNPILASQMARETLAAASLQAEDIRTTVDRATTALLDKARSNSLAQNRKSLDRPFYRLLPEERLLLIALHHGRWSYLRLAGLLDESVETIARMVWGARIRLASALFKEPLSLLPTGHALPSCPDFESENPWPQRFLDEELKPQERNFLTNHLIACGRCRGLPNDFRKIYYEVEAAIPLDENRDQDAMLARALASDYKKIQRLTGPMTFQDSLRIFWSRTYVRVIVGLFLAFLALKAIFF